jgi:hypothetical protein
MATGIRGGAAVRVLFIGNSFTARNDLPGLIAQLERERSGFVAEGRVADVSLDGAGSPARLT